MEKTMTFLGKKLLTERKKMGLTQGELAEKSECSVRMIQKVEYGQAWPGPDLLNRICGSLGLKTEDLFSTENPVVSPDMLVVDDLNQRIANAVKAGIEAANAPTVPKLDTERDRLIFAITSQLATMNEDKLRTIRSFVNDMLHLDTAAIKVKRTK